MNWDYAAGFIDGEGYLGLVRSRRLTGDRKGESWITRPTLTVYQSRSPVVLHTLRDLCDMGTVFERTITNERHSRSWFFKADGRRIQPILVELAPRLIVKRQHALLMIEFCARAEARRTRPHERRDFELIDAVASLNAHAASHQAIFRTP